MIRYGYSGLPPQGKTDEEFLDDLVGRGHQAFELAFTRGFPWKERRCAQFARQAEQRGISLSVHAPYFAMLTVREPARAQQCRAALEHTMKLGAELGASVVVAHLGAIRDESPADIMPRIQEHLEWIGSKTSHLEVHLGLETTGRTNQMGSLGDIAQLAAQFSYVRPVVDWAHLHAITQGGLDRAEAFAAVFEFLRNNFPGWMLEPLHTHFSDVLYGPGGEIRHISYGEGTLRAPLLVRAAQQAGVRMTVISESRDQKSHDSIHHDITHILSELSRPTTDGTPTASGLVEFPTVPRVEQTEGSFQLLGYARPLRLSNLDKPFFPDGFTKGDLIAFYASVAPVLLPHLTDRAIVMSRYPDGVQGTFFYEKQAPGHQPEWMPLVPFPSVHRGGVIEYVTADAPESLMWLANMGCIEIHPWLSRAGMPTFPDFAVFDLDPAPESVWEQVVEVGLLLKVALGRLGLRGYPKTSGSKGIHVYVPLEPVYEYERVRRFVEQVGRVMAAANPDNVTMDRRKTHRVGKVFVDSGQNRGGATIASVYSVRPRPGAPVSTPIRWQELEKAQPDDFTIATIWERISRYGDLFAPVLAGGQQLEEAERLAGIEPPT